MDGSSFIFDSTSQNTFTPPQVNLLQRQEIVQHAPVPISQLSRFISSKKEMYDALVYKG